MVMVCFFGLKKEKFIEGRAVLPKFFLEDVGKESFEVLGGYFVGVMEEITRENINVALHVEEIITPSIAIGSVGCFMRKSCSDFECFSNFKEIYLVSEQERRNWHPLPRDSYPKPLIFHDGRLAFRPTYLSTLAMFIWLPMGFTLAIIRIIIALTLPSKIVIFIVHLTGAQLRVFYPNNFISPSKFEKGKKGAKGVLYVCNHRTLLDPLLISYCLRTPLTAVVYSLSRMSEIISPIKTVRLTRNRERDAELMHELLSQGDLVVCPEGTTCREPYLLRFSPLFSEISDEIRPVAIDCRVSVFYGTTARGFKSLDPLFFFMNPWPRCTVRFLDVVRGRVDDYEISKYEKANLVQKVIAKELGFTCTRLTRKDKYLILAGNDGIVQDGNKIELFR
ncbi:hypothetical protein DH2020_026544 [Rehmannia glutinosa]|uniref:Phospholipid/glycerol acyltransferase domain-containing protein n=1 Tax=Rehmannia glutinosa TaxID=99300 RepID=A0ABR0VZ43_REHGL